MISDLAAKSSMYPSQVVLASLAAKVWVPSWPVSATLSAAYHSTQVDQVSTTLAKFSSFKLRLLKWFLLKWVGPLGKSIASVNEVELDSAF